VCINAIFFYFSTAVVDVPEGSGALAYMMAKAGISADNYEVGSE
jgi:hypothetical protein